jgi:phosphoglycolate phosphatase-like HAD superfamily hydrolase
MEIRRYRHVIWDWNGTLHDLDVARVIGVDCVLVAGGHHPEARLRAHTDRVLADLSDLARIFPNAAAATKAELPANGANCRE